MDQPSGGGCEQLCEQFGGEDGCPGDSQVNRVVRGFCDEGCGSIKPSCASLYAAAIVCVIALPGLCTEQGPTDGAACMGAYTAAAQCGDGDGPGPMGDCTMAQGCTCGGDTCEQCRCVGGGATCDILCE